MGWARIANLFFDSDLNLPFYPVLPCFVVIPRVKILLLIEISLFKKELGSSKKVEVFLLEIVFLAKK